MNNKAGPLWREEQLAYDQLDPCLRRFVDSAPEKFSCIWVLQQQNVKGVEATLRSGEEMLKRRYPNWRPLP